MEESLKNPDVIEEKDMPTVVTINIYGGTNQILPNAIRAEQHFHYATDKAKTITPIGTPTPWHPDDERRLSLYISNEKILQSYIATLAACTTAQQAGEAVAEMCANEPGLDGDLIAKEKFIRLLLPFLVRVKKGKGIDNLRMNINDAWQSRKKQQRKVIRG